MARAAPRFFWPAGAGETGAPLAAAAGDLVFHGGGMAAHPETGVPEGIAALDGYPHHWSRINRELSWIYEAASEVLMRAGSDLSRVMKINSFHTCADDVYEALRLRPSVFGAEPPASTLVLVPEVPVRDARVMLDMVALDRHAPREALTASTPGAPMPPHERIWGSVIYAKAVRGGGFVFTSGRTNNVIGGATDGTARGHPDFPYAIDRAEATCRMILDYLADVLASFGATLGDSVKAEIHLGDMGQIAAIDRVWREAFPDDPPARIFVPAAFPTTYSTMEIELIVRDPAGPWDREVLGDAASRRGHEPDAVRAGPYVFHSGLCASDRVHGLAPDARVDAAFPFHEDPARKEMRVVTDRLRAFGELVPLRRRVFTPDLNRIAGMDSVWTGEFGPSPTTCVRVPAPLPIPATSFQIDCVSWVG